MPFVNEREMMESEETIKLKQIRRRIEATDTDMSGSTFTDVSLSGATFNDVNLAGATISEADMSGCYMKNVNLSRLRISNANLMGVSIVESLTDGMTIDGIYVAELVATYRAANPKAD